MQERNRLPVCTRTRLFVNEPHAGGAAAGKDDRKVIDGEAHVVDTLAALGDELSDWRVGLLRLQELHQGVTGGQARDPGAIGVLQRHDGQAEHVPVEG